MSYTGRQVSQSLANSRSQVESELSAINHSISETELVIAKQNATRENTLVKLAEIFLAERADVGSQFREINGRIQAIFDEKARRRGAVDDQIAALVSDEGGIRSKIAQSQGVVDGAVKELAELVTKTDSDLKALPEYVTLTEELNALNALLVTDKQRFDAVVAECKTKLEAFNRDPFFAYLAARHYGTDSYQDDWFKKGDDWLAQATGYVLNAQSYRILSILPQKVGAAGVARTEQAKVKDSARNVLIKAVESKHGVPAARQILKVAETNKDTRLAQLKANQDAQNAMAAEKRSIDSAKDPFLQRAKEELKAFFGSQDVATLRRRAAATATTKDDELVDLLERAENTINIQRKIAKQLITQRGEVEDKLRRAKALEARFSREDYDSSRARFDSSLNVDSLMVGYLAGSMTEASVFSTFSSNHSTYVEPSYSSSYRSSSSDYSSSSSSSSWDSGSSFSGGGFDSGGSSSGGGF